MNNKEKLIYCIGDSHASFFSGLDEMQLEWPKPVENSLPFFRVMRLGPVLAYSLYRYGTKTRGRENLFKAIRKIPPKSKVLLCFGEIDCRNHILKQAALQKRALEEVVAECVDRYTSVAGELKDMGHEIILWGVSASSLNNNPPNSEFPTYGTCIERNRATAIFNRFLADWCVANKTKFVSIFDELIDSQYRTKTEFYADQIHLSQKVMPLTIAKMQKIIPDVNFNSMPGVMVITPSSIDTPVKLMSAERALRSLHEEAKNQLPHIVVDNLLGTESGVLSRLIHLRRINFAKKVYARQGITFIRKFYRDGSKALLHALRKAYDDGADLVFIHFDENIYAPVFGTLLNYAQDAFSQIGDLAMIRLGGYPVISPDSSPLLGNRSFIKISKEVSFDAVQLRPERRPKYTLWWSPFHGDMCQGKFMPVTLNFTVYRTGFLLKLLSLNGIDKLHQLSDVENYFMDNDNWQKVVKILPRKLGYINMQFGGISTAGYNDWRSFLSFPNDEIR